MKVVISRLTTSEIECGEDTCDKCRFVCRDRGEPYICRFWNRGLRFVSKRPDVIKRLAICKAGAQVPGQTTL